MMFLIIKIKESHIVVVNIYKMISKIIYRFR